MGVLYAHDRYLTMDNGPCVTSAVSVSCATIQMWQIGVCVEFGVGVRCFTVCWFFVVVGTFGDVRDSLDR